MDTGENQQALRSMIDLTRKASVVTLLLHFYVFCYSAFEAWGLTTRVVHDMLVGFTKTALFHNIHLSKLFALGILAISLVGERGKKEEKITPSSIFSFLLSGLVLYFGSSLLFYLSMPAQTLTMVYIATTGLGFILVLTGGGRFSRLIKINLGKDIFNEDNETFPQQEEKLENEYSLNFPATYNLKGQLRKMWISVVNPFRASLIIGGPGAAKSVGLVRPAILQMIEKGYCMFLYDFKFPDLTLIAYNAMLRYGHKFKKPPSFWVVNFDDLSTTHRCNPLEPSTMHDITDASEAARTILLGLNRDWIKKTGDFWVESACNFVTACIWYLRKYKDGAYCTLPHVIELMATPYDELFPVLQSEPTIEGIVGVFASAYQHRALEQLEGQIASAKIAMARITSPALYYVLSGDDFSLDINNPDDPKIVAVGNNPGKVQIYGAVLSLYITRVGRLVAKKGMQKCGIICDEFSSIFWNGIENLIAIARGYRPCGHFTGYPGLRAAQERLFPRAGGGDHEHLLQYFLRPGRGGYCQTGKRPHWKNCTAA